MLWSACAVMVCLQAGCSSRSILLGTSVAEGGTGGSAGAKNAAGSAGAAGVVSSVPILVGTVDLGSSGPAIRLLVGDVSGDGRMDIVAMQPDSVPDGRTPHSVVALTAFEIDGTRLWQLGTPDPNVTGSASDIPAQIYDIDGDGTNEVLAVMADKFLVIDGRTGQTKSEHNLPDPNAHDAIVFANLSGHRRPDDIILKDRFSNLWAYDNGFNLLFSHAGALNYYPWPYDWDGDGRDEVMAGCRFLDSDGSLLWNCETSGVTAQVDAVWAADLDPAAGNGTEIIIGAGPVMAFDTKGNRRFVTEGIEEAQNIVVGDFRQDYDGLEIAGLDRVQRGTNGTDGIFVYAADGRRIEHEQRPEGSGWSTIVTMMRNWDGTNRDLIVAYGRAGGQPTLYDGALAVVATFPEATAQLVPVDLCGDARQEIIAFTDASAHLYSTAPCDLASHVSGVPRPQPKYLYDWTRYWGGQYP